MNRYLLVLVAAGIAALGLGVAARLPRHTSALPARNLAVPTVPLRVTFDDREFRSDAPSVPANHRVLLTLVNRGSHPVVVQLAGYEDRITPGPLAPDSAWSGSFLADRPGEAFAWLVDGEPRGRLAVTGSHLVEGHR